MGRNLVICCDGTNNEFGHENTNVVRLIQSLAPDSPNQIVFYDPGVGTLPEPGVFSKVGKTVSNWLSLAFGVGLTRNLEEAYSHLMDFWQPNDRVFLFGFSRGAYTVRVLAGLLHALGLLPRGNYNLVPYVARLFKSVRAGTMKREAQKRNYWELCNAFRKTFARDVPGNDSRRFSTHFLGVWDTVSSVGWIWDPARFPFTAENPSVRVIRHAIAIDERRWFFRQNQFRPADGQDLQELWFPGVHADVGGGYAEGDGGLWRIPFEWMVNEAIKSGLLVDQELFQRVLNRVTPPARPWSEPQHESLTWKWWPAEFFPKLQWQRDSSHSIAIGRGRRRFIPQGSLIDRSALLRVRDGQYAPENFSAAFRTKVLELTTTPESLPFEW
jgi:uncharacterized protein (DUF2235 family)